MSDMKRHLELGLTAEAAEFCQGLILGLYRVRSGGQGEVLGWAPDFPNEAAGNVLEKWKAGGGRSLPRTFVDQHVPEWPWVAAH